MEIQKKNFNLKIGESVNIYFLGDIHEGNCNHADKEFRQAVKIIEADESGYWVGMAITSKRSRSQTNVSIP